MDARLRILTTYKLLNNTRYFRLRLCAGGVVTGVLAGVIISCFRLALTGAASLRANFQNFVFAGGYTPPAIALFCAALLIAAALLAWLAKAEPQAAGSGIPQVKGAVLGVFKLRWLRILLVKFAACALAIGSGLSLGRAGPSIQMGAMAGQGVSRLLARPRIEERYLISGGAAAGLAAVFNAPLAGVIFVLEEINHNFSGFLLFPVLSASVAATFTSRLILGRDTVFNFSGLPVLQYSDYWVILAAGIICGVLGALFNYGLLNAARLYKLLPNNGCLQNFLLLAVTAITGLYLPEALGGGDDLLTNTAFNSYPVTVLLMFLAAKILLTLLAFGRGLPGGAFIPTLVAGGVAGAVMAGLFSQAGLLSSAYKTNIVILSMAAFFTASVRTPITAMKRFVKCYLELLTHNQGESAKVQSAKGLHFAFSACGFGRLLLLDEVVPLTADAPCAQNTAHVALGVLYRPLGYSGFGCGLYNVLAGKLFPVCKQVKYQPFRLFGLGGGVPARAG